MLVDGAERKPDDEEESPFALCFTTKRLLSEAKIVKNARVVIVGASDTGISFAEALLSITYLQFTNITLVVFALRLFIYFDFIFLLFFIWDVKAFQNNSF